MVSKSEKAMHMHLSVMINLHTLRICIYVFRTKAVAEWFVIYMFIGKSGAFSKDDVQATYDVSGNSRRKKA